jgi:hypothetical protein
MEQKSPYTFNNFIYLILILEIFHSAFGIMTNSIALLEPEYIEFQGQIIQKTSHTFNIANIIYGVFIIISITLILKKMKLGVFIFFASCLFYDIVILAIGGKTMIGNTVISFLYMPLMAILLCLQSNKRSAWSVLFQKRTDQ